MNKNKYTNSVIEFEITKLYRQFGVVEPSQLNINNLSEIFNITVYFLEAETKLILDGDDIYMIVDSRISEIKQMESFYHELGHFLLGHYPTTSPTLFSHFEMKADYLSQYLAIPFHMLKYIDFESEFIINDISYQFGVSWDLSYKRIENIKNKQEYNYG